MAVSYSCDHHANGRSSRPMGYRFHPTDRELLKYLLGFVRNEPLPEQYQLMQQVNLYGDKDPWQIFEAYDNGNDNNNNARYFITPQKKEKLAWKRFSRTVGKGTWKPQSKGKEVFDDKGRVMGYVKSLKYTPANKSSSNANGEWLMTEYSLYNGYVDALKIKNKGFVICKIKKKEKRGDMKKGNKANVANDENMRDIEEFISSVLEEHINGTTSNDIIKNIDENNVEYLVGDEVGDHILGLLGPDDDVECIEGTEGEDDQQFDHNLLGYSAEDIDLDAYDFLV
ncbi:NAC domain-containing protein 83-like [Lycium barbarum]|uniref:NAC domain-containing protein 83-like n=1 Tax=Lycium barbarum TaxID=112863 RepID=UPI00293F0053|nr:NAC domain-containing protein 83-like [Lycium barbarum]